MQRLRHNYVLSIVVSLIIIACYHSVGGVPYYLDDFSSLVYNPLIKTPVDYHQLWLVDKARFIPYSFFALQNLFFSGQAAGFHFVSLALHIINALLVGLFAYQLAKLKKIAAAQFVFVACILLFGLLPQNTQAVIYVVQQAALLVTLFYLAALVCYLQLRLANSAKAKLLWTLLLGLSFVAALFSKQNVATLPLAILLIEWIFFGTWLNKLIKFYILAVFTGLLGLWVMVDYDYTNILKILDKFSRETSEISRLDYFRVQLTIVFHYIKQFFYPNALRLEYDWPLVQSWNFLTISFAAFHLSLLALAIVLRKKLPLLTFGLLFYYLAHSIESSVFPIKDLAFEHRTYLPNVGLVITLVALVTQLFSRQFFNKKIFQIILATFCLAALGSAFYMSAQRVAVWGDPHRFYQNEVKLSPKNPRAYTALAGTLISENNCPLALGYFEHAIALYRLQPKSNLGLQPETLQNYIGCLRQLRIFAKADFYEKSLLAQVTEPIHRSVILLQKGTFLMQEGKFAQAEAPLTAANKLNNKNYAIVMNLAIVKLKLAKFKEAVPLLEYALILKPNDKVALSLLQQLSQLKPQLKNG